jgi:hypothetical protein
MKSQNKQTSLDTEGKVLLKRLSPFKYFIYSLPFIFIMLYIGNNNPNIGLFGIPVLIVLWICVSRRANDVTETKWRYILKFIGMFLPFVLWLFPSFNKQESMQSQLDENSDLELGEARNHNTE